MHIVDLTPANRLAIQQAAEMLTSLLPEGWPTLEAAIAETQESLLPGRISRVAMETDEVLGWIGGIESYGGHVWELHPLVVRRDRQRDGIGRALVSDFEQAVRGRGGYTILVGADDERNETSLGGIDLYPDVLGRLAQIRNVGGHPYGFYQKVGFVIVGAVPDANGFGKPDILLAKRIGAPPSAVH